MFNPALLTTRRKHHEVQHKFAVVELQLLTEAWRSKVKASAGPQDKETRHQSAVHLPAAPTPTLA